MLNNKKLLLIAASIVGIIILWGSGDDDIETTQPTIASGLISQTSSPSEDVVVVDSTEQINFKNEKAQGEQQFNRAVEHLQNEEWSAAKTLLEGLASRYPSMVEAHLNLAYLYSKTGQLEQARTVLVNGVEADRNYSMVLKNLQLVHGALAAQAYRNAFVTDEDTAANVAIDELELDLPLVSSLDLSAVDLSLQKELLAKIEDFESQESSAQSSQLVMQERIDSLEAELLVASNRINEQSVKFESDLASLKSQSELQAANISEQLALERAKSSSTEIEVEQKVASIASNPIKTEPVVALVSVPEIDKITEAEQSIGIELVRNWAEQWSAQNVQGYIQSYEENYRPPSDEITHAEWREQRRERLTNKQFIEVYVGNFSFEESATQFSVSFSQRYRSNTLDDTIIKKLIFSKKDGSWQGGRIINEVIVSN